LSVGTDGGVRGFNVEPLRCEAEREWNRTVMAARANEIDDKTWEQVSKKGRD